MFFIFSYKYTTSQHDGFQANNLLIKRNTINYNAALLLSLDFHRWNLQYDVLGTNQRIER